MLSVLYLVQVQTRKILDEINNPVTVFGTFPCFVISPPQGQLYVSSFSELVEVPVANCTNYQSCGECILSRDPYCAWNGRQCVDIRQASPSKYASPCTISCRQFL